MSNTPPSTIPVGANRLELGRLVAWGVLLVFLLTSAVATLVPLVLAVPMVRARLQQWAVDKLREEVGIEVTGKVDLTFRPLGVLLRDVEVASHVPYRPLLSAQEAHVSLRPFALLAGSVAVDEIEVVAPQVDAELVDGELTNVSLHLKKSTKPSGPSRYPPFGRLRVRDGTVRLSVSEHGSSQTSLRMEHLAVTVDVHGSGTLLYDLHLQAGPTVLHIPRLQRNKLGLPDRFVERPKARIRPYRAWDDDVLCQLELQGSLTDGPGGFSIDVHRLSADGRLDNDIDPNTEARCDQRDFPDERRIALYIEHVQAELPQKGSPKVQLGPTGSVLSVAAPLGLVARYSRTKPIAGWAKVRLQPSMQIDLSDPLAGLAKASLQGTIEAHELRFNQFRFGESIHGDLYVRPGFLVGAKSIAMKYGDGLVTVEDVKANLSPLQLGPKRFPLTGTVHIAGVTLPGLMWELGVHKSAHVRWDLQDGTAKLAGYLDPFGLDGELALKTRNFEVAPGPVNAPHPGHIIGLAPQTGGLLELNSHVAVREDWLTFENLHVASGHSRLDGRVQVGFHDRLDIDVSSEAFDLSDVSPLAMFAMAGTGKLQFHLHSDYDHPQGEASLAFNNFVFDKFALGDLEQAKVRFLDELIEFSDIKARRGDSAYQAPVLRIDLGRPAGPQVDALIHSDNMNLEDLYAVLRMEKDPRWADIRAHVGFDARAHFVAGGPDDVCGRGRLDIDVGGHALVADIFGERFSGGTFDASMKYFDLEAGGLGMDLELRSATLQKKGGGTLVASGEMRRGGQLAFKVAGSNIAIPSISAVPKMTIPILGSVDVLADVSGTVDTMRIDADVSITELEIAGRRLPSSTMHVVRNPLPSQAPTPQPNERGCYTQRLPAFDLAAYLADPEVGEYRIDGELLGGTVLLNGFRLSDQRARIAKGKIAVRALDLAPLLPLRWQPAAVDLGTQEPEAAEMPYAMSGSATMDIVLDRYPIFEWWNAQGHAAIADLHVRMDAGGEDGEGQVALELRDAPPMTFAPTGLELPPTKLTLLVGGLPTTLTAAASVHRPSAASLASSSVHATVEMASFPLEHLASYMPRWIDHAEGEASGRLLVDGTLAQPSWSGELRIGDERQKKTASMVLKGLSMPLLGVTGVLRVHPKNGIVIDRFTGELGGGSLELHGGAELRGFTLGDVDVRIAARGVNFHYGAGVSTTLDTDLRATWSPAQPGAAFIPARVEGLVDLQSFIYEAPVRLLQGAMRGGGERSYDPLRDLVHFHIDVHAKNGFRARNNLVDATVQIGPAGLLVTGTNQRIGLVGELFVQNGGHLYFLRHDFEIREGTIRFADQSTLAPTVDLTAVTELRRASTTGTAADMRIRAHAYGKATDLKLELASEPVLSQDDIMTMLVIGMTRAEASQLESAATSFGLNFVADVAGVNETIKQAIPLIDDVRLGSAYNVQTGKSEPQVTFSKHLTDDVRVNVSTGLGERRTLQANVEWRLSRDVSVRVFYDNMNNNGAAQLDNLGIGLHFHFEFE